MFHLVDFIFTGLIASSLVTQLLDLDFHSSAVSRWKVCFFLYVFPLEQDVTRVLDFFQVEGMRIVGFCVLLLK